MTVYRRIMAGFLAGIACLLAVNAAIWHSLEDIHIESLHTGALSIRTLIAIGSAIIVFAGILLAHRLARQVSSHCGSTVGGAIKQRGNAQKKKIDLIVSAASAEHANTSDDAGFPWILVIDDDADFRTELCQGLQAAGFHWAESAVDASLLSHARAQKPDLILINAEMQAADAFAACRQLRQDPLLSPLPIVMITRRDGVQSAQNAYAAGANGFAAQPVNLPLLVEQIRFFLRAADHAAQLRENQARLYSAQRMAKLGYWRWSAASDVFEPSERLTKICGVPAQHFATGLHSFIAMLHSEDQQSVKDAIEAALHSRESSTMEYRLVGGREQALQIRQVVEVGIDKSGQATVFGTMQDITQLRNNEDRIRQLAYYDPLTALASRSYLLQRIEESIKSARRRDQAFSLMFMDLDGFKDVNDSLGHDIGDQLLVTIATRLRGSLRETDFIARLGGDEFCVLLDSIKDSYNIVHAAERCLIGIEKPVDLGSQWVRPRMSIGIANFPEDGDSSQSLLKAADSAMYAAKRQGKHRYAFYDPEMTRLSEQRLSLATELRDAFLRREFVVYYQPLIDIKTGVVHSMEALVRWQHPQRGLVPPNKFIPELEQIGLIGELGEFVLRDACEQVARWRREGLPPVKLSVNISPDHFRSAGLTAMVSALLKQTGLSPETLLLEVTESVAQYHDEALATFKQLKGIGVNIAIDDFGTGYSSLGSLKFLPIDCLKVDRAFVRDMLTDNKDSILLGTIFGLAHALNFSVVAEGVESQEQVQVLHSLGCDFAQGYFFSKPVPAREAAELLSRVFLPAEKPGAAAMQPALAPGRK